ncbi:hypothetical protein OAD42_05010 [Oceanospirillaceae bacterium]|nr:hypothetical protein [Oceanospirillaceae bacterium]
MDDLVFREGLYYEKFTDVPFNGKVTGNPQGSYKNGKRDGAWVGYHNTGQLGYKGNYKRGQREGYFVNYYSNGQLRRKGTWKNDKREGIWVEYERVGTVVKSLTGTFKNGVKISD